MKNTMNVNGIKNKIISLRNDPFELSGFLTKLFKNDYNILQDEFLMSELEDCLFNRKDWILKKTALDGLLIYNKLDNKNYIQRALNLLTNPQEDKEVRTYAIFGLTAINNKNNFLITDTLKSIGFNNDEVETIRCQAIQGLLELHGVTLSELYLRDGYIPIYDDEFTIEGFINFVNDDLKKFNLLP